MARHRNTKQWLQVDLGSRAIVKGIATQGRQDANQWVSSYTISFSRYGRRFRSFTSSGRIKVGARSEMFGFFCFVFNLHFGKGLPWFLGLFEEGIIHRDAISMKKKLCSHQRWPTLALIIHLPYSPSLLAIPCYFGTILLSHVRSMSLPCFILISSSFFFFLTN